jgi:hypothetical protein
MLLMQRLSLIDGIEIKRREKTVTGCIDTGSVVDPELPVLIPDPTSETLRFLSQIMIRTIFSKVFQKKHVVCLILCYPKYRYAFLRKKL